MNSPKILVIIVTWNKKDYVLQLLGSLDGLDFPREQMDVLVVDNASNDGTAEAIAERYPAIHLIRNPDNVGGTGGFNTGMAWAFQQPPGQYDYLWLLDNDVLVHRCALRELVEIMQASPAIGIVGSTMMQLDYPWRINEMGCYIELGAGKLVFNRHLEEVMAWRNREAVALAADDTLKLSRVLMHCQRSMDVDYVAAASLLIRADLAREAGLWKDFFIHYDDVEWCLRIGEMGWRVLVAADSIIWHLSSAAKIPTWVLYYDTRNRLVTLQSHGADSRTLNRNIQRALLVAVYFALLGKPDLGQLHLDAVDDFLAGRLGKKDIRLTTRYQANSQMLEALLNPSVKRILIGQAHLQATNIQQSLIEAMRQRPELQVDCLTLPGGERFYQLPRARFVCLPLGRIRRYWQYWRLRGRYDLVMQSDYKPYLPLSWVGRQVMFVNDESFCVNPKPRLRDAWPAAIRWLRGRLRALSG